MGTRERIAAGCLAALLVVMNAAAAVSQTSAPTDTARAEREHKIESMLKDYRGRLDELNERLGAVAENARKESKQALDELGMRHREASERLGKLREATNERWGEVNRKLQSSLDELRKSYDHAREKLGTKEQGQRGR